MLRTGYFLSKIPPQYRQPQLPWRMFQRKHFIRALPLFLLAVVLINTADHRHHQDVIPDITRVPVARSSVGHVPRPCDRRAVRTVMESDGHIRNCVTGRVLGRLPAGGAFRTEPMAAVYDNVTEDANVRRRVFKKVFEKKIWRHSDSVYKGSAVSGSPLYSTMEIMAQLHVAIEHLKMRYGLSRVRLLDVPCGDMLWMSQFLATRDDIDYTGIDIVPELIASHRKLFADRPTWKFHVVDIVRDGIGNWSTADGGDGHYDLVLSRRMLQHLMLVDVVAVLSHLSTVRTGDPRRPTFLLASTFAHEAENSELRSGDVRRFQPLNLLIPPISLAPPLCLGRDYVHTVVSYVGMWSLPVRRVVGCDSKKSLSMRVDGISEEMYSCVDWSWPSPTKQTP